MEFALRGALSRHHALGINPVTVDFRQHPNRDGGARTTGPEILALEADRFRHALLVLDHEGSGSSETAVELEKALDKELEATWGDRAKAIVIEPELDTWMWGSDNLLRQLLNWPFNESIREWLKNKGFEFAPDNKPERPKEAMEAVFPVCRMPRSASNYQRIAERISLSRCSDEAFNRLQGRLREWFPSM